MSKLEQHEFSDYDVPLLDAIKDEIILDTNESLCIGFKKEDVKAMAQHFGLIGEDDE